MPSIISVRICQFTLNFLTPQTHPLCNLCSYSRFIEAHSLGAFSFSVDQLFYQSISQSVLLQVSSHLYIFS